METTGRSWIAISGPGGAAFLTALRSPVLLAAHAGAEQGRTRASRGRADPGVGRLRSRPGRPLAQSSLWSDTRGPRRDVGRRPMRLERGMPWPRGGLVARPASRREAESSPIPDRPVMIRTTPDQIRRYPESPDVSSECSSTIDSERFKLLYGPYVPPKCGIGGALLCEHQGRKVSVRLITDAPIPWPAGGDGPCALPILCGDLILRHSSQNLRWPWPITGR